MYAQFYMYFKKCGPCRTLEPLGVDYELILMNSKYTEFEISRQFNKIQRRRLCRAYMSEEIAGSFAAKSRLVKYEELCLTNLSKSVLSH